MDKDLIQNEINEFKEKIDLYRQGKISPEDFKRRRLQQGIYAIRAQTDIQMVRVRIPSGRFTAEQLERLADIAREFSTGIGHVTTREDIQFHWVRLENVIEVISKLAEVGLTTREACGNTVRNVTACHLAGVCPYELFDVSPYSLGLSQFLVRNSICQALPRKFKITFSGCSKDCSLCGIHDIGALATRKEQIGSSESGFKLFVGGGLGPLPRASEPLEEFTPIEDLIPTCEAVVRVFDRLGERKNRARARMKFVLAKLGIESFRNIIFEEREKVRTSTAKVSLPHPSDENRVPSTEMNVLKDFKTNNDLEFQQWLKTNVIPQKQKGYFACTIRLSRGDITSEQMKALAGCAREFSSGQIRTDTNQNMLLVGIRQDELINLYARLKIAGLNKSGAYLTEDVVCCPGTDTCNLGITSSRGLGLELTRLMDKDGHIKETLKGVNIKISGCPNSCAQHHIAALGFYGGARQLEGRLIPYYQFLFGGSTGNGKVVFGKPVIKLPAKRVPALILRLVEAYENGRGSKEESFVGYFDRIGIEAMRHLVAGIEKPLPFAQAANEYYDWERTEEFNLVGIGPGECAM